MSDNKMRNFYLTVGQRKLLVDRLEEHALKLEEAKSTSSLNAAVLSTINAAIQEHRHLASLFELKDSDLL